MGGTEVVAARLGDRPLCARLRMAMGFWPRFRGLMGRRALGPDEGLYLPVNSIHMLFMRFPVDALFVSHPDDTGGRRVVAMRHDLPPWRGVVLPMKGATGVLELPAGTLRRVGPQPGDRVWLEAPAPRAGPG